MACVLGTNPAISPGWTWVNEGVIGNVWVTISRALRQVDIKPAHDSTLHQHFPLTAGPSYHPALGRLITYHPAPRGRIPLITTIFSDPNEVEAVKQLCGDDAQKIVDLIHQEKDRYATGATERSVAPVAP